MKTFGERLSEARQDQGWSQDELAARLAPYAKDHRLSRESVSQWEGNDSLPQKVSVAAVAQVLGVNPSWLQFEEGEKRANQAVEMVTGAREVESGQHSFFGIIDAIKSLIAAKQFDLAAQTAERLALQLRSSGPEDRGESTKVHPLNRG